MVDAQPNIGHKLSILKLIFAYSSWLIESLLLEMRWLHEFDVKHTSRDLRLS